MRRAGERAAHCGAHERDRSSRRNLHPALPKKISSDYTMKSNAKSSYTKLSRLLLFDCLYHEFEETCDASAPVFLFVATGEIRLVRTGT